MQPKITVVIPTYNKANYISQTIDSVLNQTVTDFEIIIVDDFSSDNTEEIVKPYLAENIKYYKHNTNWGPGATFNDGIEKARAEFVTLIASDDILLPEHLDLVLKEFKSNKEVEAVFCKLKVIDENNKYIDQIQSAPYTDKYKLLNHQFYIGNYIPAPGASFKKSLFNKIEGFNPNLILMHDYDLNVRILINSEFRILSEATVLYRRFSNNKNLSGNNNWYRICHKFENNIVLDNYLKLSYNDMIQVFPEFKKYTEDEIILRFIIETFKHEDKRLSSWAGQKLLEYLNNDAIFFKKNKFDFQYKDYIKLYRTLALGSKQTTHKQRLYEKFKKILKLFFGLK